jgi:PTH1 family peptidyl-tRNA hydrolase
VEDKLEDLYIIAGLGNPGLKYSNTRHNVGFDTIDLLAYKHDIKVTKVKHKALVGEGKIGGKRVLLVKPQTFMNLSGESIREILEWFKVPSSRVIIIYDDIDLAIGKFRLRAKGSSGTHNGMKSIIYQIQTDDFPRIRIGIDKPPANWDLADYVLGRFGTEERKIINESITNAAEAAAVIVEQGIEKAMNLYNGK